MSKILSIDDLLEAACESHMPDLPSYVAEMEDTATKLAQALAAHLGIRLAYPANWEGKEYGGVCASFGPAFAGQPCPKVIDNGDPGGDWELEPGENPPAQF